MPVAHLNIQSLLGNVDRGNDSHCKIDDLRCFLPGDNAPLVLCLSETWLSTKADSELNMDNKTNVRKDRKCHQDGGMLMYVNQQITFSEYKIDVMITLRFALSKFIPLVKRF